MPLSATPVFPVNGQQGDRARWNARYKGVTPHVRPPEALRRLAEFLPDAGLAIDLAGGTGGGALFMAARGLPSVVVDVSDVAISQAGQQAARAAAPVSSLRLDIAEATMADLLSDPALTTLIGDQAVAGSGAEVGAGVGIVTCFHYLQKRLLRSVADGLPPGARFMAAIATTINLERNERPSARFLLKPGELRRLVAPDGEDRLTVLHDEEGWHDGDHHEAELVVEREAG